MKKFMMVIGIAVLCFVSASAVRAEIRKVGYLDLSRIFDNYEKTKEYDVVLEEQYSRYESERNTKVEKIQEHQGRLALLKEDERRKAEEEMQGLINELQQYDMEQRTELTRRRDERIREILLEVEQVVADYARKEGFDLIFNDRVLIFGSDGMDITDPILKFLNDAYKK
jgi:outer membrane protein